MMSVIWLLGYSRRLTISGFRDSGIVFRDSGLRLTVDGLGFTRIRLHRDNFVFALGIIGLRV